MCRARSLAPVLTLQGFKIMDRDHKIRVITAYLTKAEPSMKKMSREQIILHVLKLNSRDRHVLLAKALTYMNTGHRIV